ncbi:mannose/fructose/sorbose PTS transporter subunit IIA [Psittacicella gerlachiana]|uniref:PTS system mannose-specific EIIAB component n=1 Tax=Psittacicella gerlachiana TaxID=2028574 RepID=A0A3A1Y4P3_9GAMM|nr:mannose/fructose/sorbose PTS transporter subunit IIA [Psittacicella gerlachiana]RIY32236.1 PTS mannose transporter subunit IIAB [Psittacicella gerlachiana]
MSEVFIIATHGVAAKQLLATTEMLLGEQTGVHAVDFVPGENADTLAAKYREIMAQYPEDQKFLFLVDLWGGSPFNAANLAAGQNPNAIIVTGVNIPALLNAFSARDDEELPLEEIAAEAVKGARSGVRATHQGQEILKEAPTAPVAVSQASSTVSANQAPAYNGPSKIGSQVIEPLENDKHFTIGLTRIDDRLIHGQVATVWTKVSEVSRILVINNDVAKDKVRSTMLKQSTPPGVTAHVLDLAKATRVMNNPEYAGERFMLLFTNPEDILTLVREAKWPIKEVNVGGISFKEGKTNLTKAVNVTPEDVAAFKELNSLGVKLEVRQVVNEKSVDLMKIFADKGLA